MGDSDTVQINAGPTDSKQAKHQARLTPAPTFGSGWPMIYHAWE